MATHPLLNNDNEPEVDDTTEDEVQNPEVDEVPESEDDQDDKPLGPAGERALRARKEEIRTLKAEIKRLKSSSVKEETDPDDLRGKIRAELALEFGVELAREKAVNLLTKAGYKGNPDRGAKLLDLESVVDGGKVDMDTLSDLVDEWRSDEPQLFKQSRQSRVDDDDDTDEPPRRGSQDLGKVRRRQDVDPLAQALGAIVGKPVF